MILAAVDLHSVNPVIRLLSQQKKAPKDDVLITVNKRNSQRKAVITWTDEKIGPQSGQLQDIVTFGQSVSDPVKAYLNVKVSLGNAN